MKYDIKTLTGIADLTQNWDCRREQFYQFACGSDDERWQDPSFRNHMYFEYIKTDTPITVRLYSLDASNQRTLLRYVNEQLMDGMAELEVEV